MKDPITSLKMIMREANIMKDNHKHNETVRDIVCGMRIAPEDAADIEVYAGQIFYFCALSCKLEFNKNPEDYFLIHLVEERKHHDQNNR